MYHTYPKGKGSLPKPVKDHSESLGSMHRRATLGRSEEERANELATNHYGKKAAPEMPEKSGIMSSPRKTMITIG